MKKRLSSHQQLPPLFNLGLHRQKHPVIVQWDHFLYERKSETLVNPLRKALKLTEFVTFFWTLLATGAKIALINTDENRAFNYENWFDGTSIKCYEGLWVPGLWTNPLRKNPVPDLVILLSVNWKEKAWILGELVDLNIPILNFSSEYSDWNQFKPAVHEEYKLTHFYMEIIRFVLMRFQQLHDPLNYSNKPTSKEIALDYHNQLKQIGNVARPRTTAFEGKKLLCTYPKIIRNYCPRKKLIYLKRKKRYVGKQLKSTFWTLHINFPKSGKYLKKKGYRSQRPSKHLSVRSQKTPLFTTWRIHKK